MAAQTVYKSEGQSFHVGNPTFADVAVRGRATTLPRDNVAVTTVIASGVVNYTYFTARKTIRDVDTIETYTSVVSATITTQKQGVYQENPETGVLTLLAITDNETSAWNGADTSDALEFLEPFDLIAGNRYAVATLSVATTGPTLLGSAAVGATVDAQVAAIWGRAPKMAAQFAAQTDLVASVTNAQAAAYTATPIRVYAELYKA